MSDYLFDKSGDDPEVAELERLLGTYAHRAPLRAPPPPRPRRRRARAAFALAAIAALAAALVLWRREGVRSGESADCREGGSGFTFSALGGPARCGGDAATRGALPVGTWLETPGGTLADVRVPDLGALTLHEGSRLRLVGAGPGERRFELARGRVSARVLAPPRLFVVDTPAAAAVDLGCAYDLEVDATGHTHLRVTSGAVSLEGRGLRSYVPMGAEVVAAPGRGPGTPLASDASAALRQAVARFDAGDLGAGPALVAAAGPRDTVTLWNLLLRTAGEGREAAFRKLDEVSARPPGVSEAAVLAGDPEALEDWRRSLDGAWMAH